MYLCTMCVCVCLQAQSLASSLSTRQLLRICRRLSRYPEESIAHAVNKACLSRYTFTVPVFFSRLWCTFSERRCVIVSTGDGECVCVCLRFLPSLARSSLDKSLADCSMQDTADPSEHLRDLSCKSLLPNTSLATQSFCYI